MELKDLLPRVLAIARGAGRKILEVYETPFDVANKDDRSPLTAADLASHAFILEALQALTRLVEQARK